MFFPIFDWIVLGDRNQFLIFLSLSPLELYSRQPADNNEKPVGKNFRMTALGDFMDKSAVVKKGQRFLINPNEF